MYNVYDAPGWALIDASFRNADELVRQGDDWAAVSWSEQETEMLVKPINETDGNLKARLAVARLNRIRMVLSKYFVGQHVWEVHWRPLVPLISGGEFYVGFATNECRAYVQLWLSPAESIRMLNFDIVPRGWMFKGTTVDKQFDPALWLYSPGVGTEASNPECVKLERLVKEANDGAVA